VDKDGEFVGLLFAGSANSAVICKAEHVIDGLGIAVEPPYSLTISSTPGGNVTEPGKGMSLYDAETVVNLVAVSDEHYHFVEWTGDVGTVGNFSAAETTITVDGNYRITAGFELDPGWYGLTLSSTPGGSVINPGEGVYVCEANTTVDLLAANETHYQFGNWTGDAGTIGNVLDASTNITMDNSYSVTANFKLDPGWCSLTVSSSEGGSVTTPGEGIFVRAENATVPLVAEPDGGYEFVRWTGDVSTIDDIHSASTTISMNGSYSVTALFNWWYPEPMAQLMISSTSNGSVDSPGEGTWLYPLGEEVTLVAVPDGGYQFVRWSGDVDTVVDVYAASTTITIDGPYTIRADFSGAGWCFIATAAYGTSMAEEIEILREFRDEYLLTSPVGKALVEFYYRVSPPIAEFITEHPSLKPIVRAGLLPAVAMSNAAVNITPAEKTAIAGLLVLLSVAMAVWAARRRGRGPEYT